VERIVLGWLAAGKERDPFASADAVLGLANDAALRGLRPPRAGGRA
jgi:hypothetical protein